MSFEPEEKLANPYQIPQSETLDALDDKAPATPERIFFHPMNLVLVAGFAFLVWISAFEGWLFQITVPLATLFSGVIGHLIYEHLLRIRLAVPLVVLLIVNFTLQFLWWFHTGHLDLKLLIQLPILIPSSIRYTPFSISILFVLAVLCMVAFVMLAHPIRPNFRNAIVTSMAIHIWYATSLMILSQAG